jgi:hypothetical protein
MVDTVAWCRLHICNLSPDLPFGSGKRSLLFIYLKDFVYYLLFTKAASWCDWQDFIVLSGTARQVMHPVVNFK